MDAALLELFFIWTLSKSLAEKARLKGRSKGWGALGPAMWITGEMIGFLVGSVLLGDGVAPYLCGIGMAILGAVIANLVVGALAPVGAVEPAA